jgi:predicted acylesterase/phospholipase RssA
MVLVLDAALSKPQNQHKYPVNWNFWLNFLLVLACVAVQGCTDKLRDPPQSENGEYIGILGEVDVSTGYRPSVRARAEQATNPDETKTGVVLSLSGGGTRAGALSAGTLLGIRRVQEYQRQSNLPVVPNIDLITATSGSSAVAMAYALNSDEAFSNLFELYLIPSLIVQEGHDAFAEMASLIFPWGPIMIPATLLTMLLGGDTDLSAIDDLASRLNKDLFESADFGRLVTLWENQLKNPVGNWVPPYVVINATDYDTATGFYFTQQQFDLLCRDLSEFEIARAVAASAAFPGAFDTIRIQNLARLGGVCEAHREVSDGRNREWIFIEDGIDDLGIPARTAVRQRDLEVLQNTGMERSLPSGAYRRSVAALSFLNLPDLAEKSEEGIATDPKRIVHLLDGGVSDNLAISYLIGTLIDGRHQSVFVDEEGPVELDSLLIVVVNASTEFQTEAGNIDKGMDPFSTANSAFNAAITNNSYNLLERLNTIDSQTSQFLTDDSQVDFVAVGFDQIRNARCRRKFNTIESTKITDPQEVFALAELGQALVVEQLLPDIAATDMGVANTFLVDIDGEFLTQDKVCAKFLSDETWTSPALDEYLAWLNDE